MFHGPPKTSIAPPWKVEFAIVPVSSALVLIKIQVLLSNVLERLAELLRELRHKARKG